MDTSKTHQVVRLIHQRPLALSRWITWTGEGPLLLASISLFPGPTQGSAMSISASPDRPEKMSKEARSSIWDFRFNGSKLASESD